MLRPALELALAVAREGVLAEPPLAPPRTLRPILSFNRLPASARRVVLRALDQDDAFRARVAASAVGQEGSLGRAGWLFLVRPDGWEIELEQLQAAAAETSSAGAQAREERTAQRRLRGAEEAAQRAEEQLVRARAELAAANAALAAERLGRRQAETGRDALQRRVGSLERERDAAHRRAAAAQTEAARVAEELREQRAVVVSLQEEATAAAVAPAPTTAQTPARTAPPAAAAALPVAEVSLDKVRAAVEEAAAAAAGLGAALAAAARALRPPAPPDDGAVPTEPSRGGRRGTAAAPLPPRRLPLALPPGLLEGSREAAEFLVRCPGMVVVVDGYNATLRRWPEHPIAEQRQRLVQALAGLSARSGCEVHVVFDGAGDLARAPSVPRGRVRVTFSPAGVEADDLILDLVDQAPANRPVAVSSDDRRVRREAAARGANTLSQEQLFAVAALDA